jgi:hypothetical protein
VNPLKDYRAQYGLSHEQLAAELSERLGRPVKPERIAMLEKAGKSRIPKSYSEALGLGLGLGDVSGSGGAASSQGLDGAVRDSEPPRPPDDAGAPTAPASSAAVDGSSSFHGVRDRLAKAYGAIGAGASMLTQNDGYAVVADAYSRDLADAWLAAAEENANVAKVVAFMQSGGPVGELVIAHLILVGGFVYVSGRGPDLDFLYAGKFSGHRALAAQRILEAERAEWADANGSAPVGAQGPVVDAPG